MKLMSVLSLLMTGATAFAAADQYVEVAAFDVIDNGQVAKYKALCAQIGKDAQSRMDAYLALNPDMNPSQVNVSAKYSIEYGYRGGIGSTMSDFQRFQHCDLRVRLNDATRTLSVGKSDVYFTGRGKRKPCEALKTEIDANPGVIYSELNLNLFRCNIKPIILIEKK